MEETEETVAYIAMITLVFFLILILGFWILNRRLSKNLWQPFQDTLQKLKTFELNSQKQPEFQETDTIEFAELNATLNKLIQHGISTYKNQKEFTENASHELQTPLAILKNKVDILLQSDDLTEKQYEIAEEMNKALIRSSRINKNLLLLAKIENSQFDHSELIDFDELVKHSKDSLQEYFEEKHLAVRLDLMSPIQIKGNNGLIDILLNNLLINAIRYTSKAGEIYIRATQSGFEIANSGQQKLNDELLFKRFSKISTENSGSGLGLPIVQEICRLHHWQANYHFEGGEHVFKVIF
ncbi:sensor histidine kinase [Sphingobacterium hungaricum]|nr:HAMP domain-containing sensor histidine kinase [Sphingobacterium hungaricum]